MTEDLPGNLNGFIVADKPAGVTSHRFLEACAARVGKGVKAGHAGTLDSFATGVLICLFGSYTRLSDYFMGAGKSYEAEILFGEETDTLDPEGKVIASAPVPERKELEAALTKFRGEIMQAPPAYSSVHIDGRRARERALKGEDVRPAPRPVTISSLELLSFSGDRAVISVSCSKGTYIRSLARDLALASGSRGRLAALRRTSSGPFKADEAISLERCASGSLMALGMEHAKALGLRTLELGAREKAAFANGLPLWRLPQFREDAEDGSQAVFGPDGRFLGVVEKTGRTWRYACVIGARE